MKKLLPIDLKHLFIKKNDPPPQFPKSLTVTGTMSKAEEAELSAKQHSVLDPVDQR